jgi:predicted GH43/DUF377 family glycosyl hydrolase
MNMLIKYKQNPIITPAIVKPLNPDFEVIGVFNAGFAKKDDEYILLVRVAEKPINDDPSSVRCTVYDEEKGSFRNIDFPKSGDFDFSDVRIVKTVNKNYLTSISNLRVARSKDGIHFQVEPTAAFPPSNKYEAYGVEDARITQIDDVYYITYSAASDIGIVVTLAQTTDFETFQRKCIMFPPDNKDVAIFPQVINGSYYALHRPSTSEYGKPDIWISRAVDPTCFGDHRVLARVRPGYWDSKRIGAGAVPFLTDKGWVEIYHGADENNRYCLGVLLLDKDDPGKVIARSETPLVEPTEIYERKGFFGNVVFTCGCCLEGDDVIIYYGASDETISMATVTLDDIFSNLGIV